LPAWWPRYLHSVSAADPAQIPLSLLFLELIASSARPLRFNAYPPTALSSFAGARTTPDTAQRYVPPAPFPPTSFRPRPAVSGSRIRSQGLPGTDRSWRGLPAWIGQ